jgi:uncharacterized protein (DUF58 family)
MRAPRLLQRARLAWEARWNRWMTRRIPPAREVLLSQRNVFIMPSAAGFVFLFLLLALLLAGVNYENNLVFALTFLLAGLFVVAILHTYANLAGLRLAGAAGAPVFAGERAAFSVRLRDQDGRCHDAVELAWGDADEASVRVAPGGEGTGTLYVRAPRRGWLDPGRLRLRTYYPLGLLRAWSWIDLDLACVVYPRPAAGGALPLDRGRADEGFATHEPGAEDFSGFRDYVPGDPLRHVAWKTLAKGQPLQTREYVAYADRAVWLDWEQTRGRGSDEERLSLLCRWVLDLHAQRAEFGLALPGVRIEPASGDAHRERALTALALHGQPARGAAA